jgi:hypothetical protein
MTVVLQESGWWNERQCYELTHYQHLKRMKIRMEQAGKKVRVTSRMRASLTQTPLNNIAQLIASFLAMNRETALNFHVILARPFQVSCPQLVFKTKVFLKHFYNTFSTKYTHLPFVAWMPSFYFTPLCMLFTYWYF